MRSQLWSENRKIKRGRYSKRMKFRAHVAHMCLQLQPLVVWICIPSGTWKTQPPRQTMDRWLIRCVRLLSEKVRAEIKCHLEHPTGVYWKGAGMQRMSAVWVCPWMRGANKMCPTGNLWNCLYFRGWMPPLSISHYRLNEMKYPLHVWDGKVRKPYTESLNLRTDIHFSDEVYCRPQMKASTVTDSQTEKRVPISLSCTLYVILLVWHQHVDVIMSMLACRHI